MNRASLSPRQRFERRIVAALVACDVLACLAAIALAYVLRLYVPENLLTRLAHPPELYARAAPVVVGLWFIAFFARGLYDVRRFRSRFAEAVATLSAVAVATILVAAASFMSRTDYSRAMLILFWLSGSVLAVIERSLLSRYREHRIARSDAESLTAIVGCGDLAEVVAKRYRNTTPLRYRKQTAGASIDQEA